jgi:DNA-binding NarL/FixJ family response regulator
MVPSEICQSRTSSAGGVARKSRIHVLSVDDHLLIREGIVAVIKGQTDMQVVAQVSNGHEAVECFGRHMPDITLMDLRLSLNSPKVLLLAQLCRQLSASNSGLAAGGKGSTISP